MKLRATGRLVLPQRVAHFSRASVCLWLVATTGCSDLSKFQLDDNEAYCGRMVSAPLFQSGFVPEGTGPALEMRMHLDVDALTTAPGTLTSDDRNRGLCRDNDQPLFDEAPLRAIPEVLHDAISTLEFGQGREHSFFAYVDSTCQGTMLAVVSLMHNKDVELRLFKPAPAAGSSGYALFYLQPRETANCGF